MRQRTNSGSHRSRLLLSINRIAAVLILLCILAMTSYASRPAEPDDAPCRLPVALAVGATRQTPKHLCWGLIGNAGAHLAEEYDAGIRYKVFDLDWSAYMPAKGKVDADYVADKRAELATLRAAGFAVILNLGFHNPPDWVHDLYADSYYVNQYGDRYTADVDAGDVNLIFNSDLRGVASTYFRDVFRAFGSDFAAVRLGGGRYGELTYPPAEYNGNTNCYWAFDANALARSPTPGWRPGDAANAQEAQTFINWYLDELVNFQNWQIGAVRDAGYTGPLMILYPSWGIRPGDLADAVRSDLTGSTSAEINGEIQRGYDFARQIAAIHDPGVIVTTTWLDADASRDDDPDSSYWSPVKFLAKLAQAQPLHLPVYGENTGQGSREQMELSAAQAMRYGLVGMAWFNEGELFSGRYATLADYQWVITAYSYSEHP